jgi:iron complex outermembrane receptor protein
MPDRRTIRMPAAAARLDVAAPPAVAAPLALVTTVAVTAPRALVAALAGAGRMAALVSRAGAGRFGVAAPLAMALSLAAAVLAAAQAPSAPPTLAPVVVETSVLPPERTRTLEQAQEDIDRTPGGVEIVPQRTIEESRAANLKDVLDFVPGVLIRPRFGAADESQLSIRGSGLRNNFHLRGVNVLIDGFPYGNADGFSDFESLELLTTRYIEVWKGASALRFGGNTMGGAVNLVTKTGHDAGLVESRVEAGSFGFFKGHLGTGQVYGPLDLYASFSDVELQGYRDHSQQVRRRAYGTVGYLLPGGATLRFDLGFVRNEEQLPGALTPEQFEQAPRQQNPAARFAKEARNYDYTRGALTLRVPIGTDQAFEWASQLNYQDLDHPLAFAVIDDTTYSYSTELRYQRAAPLFGRGNRFTAGFQFFGTRQHDAQFQNIDGDRGAMIKNQINIASTFGLYAENQHDVVPAVSLVTGGRLQLTHDAVRDRYLANGNQSDSVSFFGATPKLGFVWKAAPTVQVFGNASRAYEPPLLLELTAPGQIGGGLGELRAQTSWQFELGTRGTWGERTGWDVSVYDIELWNEIQNVNVQPFPGAPFTIPRFQNIDRSRHTGVEVGGDLLLIKDLAGRLGLGAGGDALRARLAYTWSRFVLVDDPTFDDNDLPGAPAHQLNAELRYDHASGFWVAPGVEIVPRGYFVDSANTTRTPAYTLVNVKAGFEYRPWGLGVLLEARNLADTSFVSAVNVDDANRNYFYPGDGRAFYGSVAWRWK